MITLDDLKKHLVIELTDDDAMLGVLIPAAIDTVEKYCRRVVVERTVTEILDGFGDFITLKEAGLISVTSVKYKDGDDVQQTLGSAAYRVDTRELKAEVHPAYNTVWPAVTNAPESVEVTYQAGYTAGNEPGALRVAALMIAGSLYEQRENHITGTIIQNVPVSAEYLMAAYTIVESVE